jgi:hypothetical protein
MRCEHPVAEEQPGPEDAEDDEHGGPGHLAALGQRGQRHDPAVTAVVCTHDDAGVLDRDDDRQRPEDERDDAVDAGDGGMRRVAMGGEDDLLGVQRARPDVAVHDPQCAEREHHPAGVRDDVALLVGGGPKRRRWPGRLLGGRRLDRPVVQLVCGFVEAAAHARPRGRSGLGVLADRRPELVRRLVVAVPAPHLGHGGGRLSGSSAAATARSRLPSAPRSRGAYSALLPSVRSIRSIARPRAVTGVGARSRRSIALSTTLAAWTSSACGLTAALSPKPESRALRRARTSPAAIRRRLRRPVSARALTVSAAVPSGDAPAASCRSSSADLHHASSRAGTRGRTRGAGRNVTVGGATCCKR